MWQPVDIMAPTRRGQVFRAKCQHCPWKGPIRPTEREALRDGSIHDRAHPENPRSG